jgi:hypothetical protein
MFISLVAAPFAAIKLLSFLMFEHSLSLIVLLLPNALIDEQPQNYKERRQTDQNDAQNVERVVLPNVQLRVG